MRAIQRLRQWWRAVREPPTLGQKGEAAAARHLQRLGYRILARGSRSPLGEIDLIAADGQTIVFVEVKTRSGDELGHPSDAVDAAKQRRLTRLALNFLKRHRLLDYPARFDIVAVVWPASQRRPTIEHLANAFEASGLPGMHS